MDSFLANTIKSGTSAGQPIVPTVNFQNGTPNAAPQPVAPRPVTVAPVATPTQAVSPTPSGLDPQIVNLARAIRQEESGGDFTRPGKSGEYGAYQFMPSTWAGNAPRFGVNVPLTQATPEQQNEVAYKQLAEWKQQHPEWNVGNFASAWNAGPGKPNAYMEGNVGVNSKGVRYDTPAYALKVATAYQQFKGQNPEQAPVDPSVAPGMAEAAPSLGGFAQNVVHSGLGLLGNVGEALLHPIQTVQSIGGAAVGGIEKAAGQDTENTAKFDGVVNFFKDRYGSLAQLEKTLYNDPVGVAADLSTVLGGGGLALKGASLGAKIGKAGEVAGALDTAAGALGKASDFTNPLAPIGAGLAKAVNPAKEAAISLTGSAAKFEGNTIEMARAGKLTPDTIANTSRQSIGSEVSNALDLKTNARDAAMAAYKPIREADTAFAVTHDFLDKTFRDIAKVEVQDGKIVPTSSSLVRSGPEISKLQNIYNLYKPDFLSGKLSSNKFLNLRNDLYDVAYNEIGKKNSKVAQATDAMAARLNAGYRDKIPGLKSLDETFTTEQKSWKELKKGLIGPDGNLTDGFYTLVANAGNPSNASRLARLEKLVPGIGEKLKLLKAVEDMQKSLTKTGTYSTSILESGSILAGVATGHLGVAATGFAAMIISRPENAVKIIDALNKIDPALATATMARVARYATFTGESSRATNGSETSPTSEPPLSPQEQSSPPPLTSDGASSPSEVPGPVSPDQLSTQSLEDLAKTHNFDLEAAHKEGYTDQEIKDYLTTQQ